MNNYGKDAIIIEFKVLDSESGETSLADTVQDTLEEGRCPVRMFQRIGAGCPGKGTGSRPSLHQASATADFRYYAW